MIEASEIKSNDWVIIDDGQYLTLVESDKMFSALVDGGWGKDGSRWIEPYDEPEAYTNLCNKLDKDLAVALSTADNVDDLERIKNLENKGVAKFTFLPAENPYGFVWRWL